MANKNIEQIISEIKNLKMESYKNAKNSSRNHNVHETNAEWWYNGELNAYEKVLQILEEAIKE